MRICVGYLYIQSGSRDTQRTRPGDVVAVAVVAVRFVSVRNALFTVVLYTEPVARGACAFYAGAAVDCLGC